MFLCLNTELADRQKSFELCLSDTQGYLPVVSRSEHNLLTNLQFINPKGNLSLQCTWYCENKMLHKGASNIKAFCVHFNQYHFYLIYSPVLNFLAASKTKKWYFQFYTCKKNYHHGYYRLTSSQGKVRIFFESGKNLYFSIIIFFFSGKGQGILKTDVRGNHVTHKEKTMEW